MCKGAGGCIVHSIERTRDIRTEVDNKNLRAKHYFSECLAQGFLNMLMKMNE